MLGYRDASIRRKLIVTVLATAGLAVLVACTAFVTYDVITLRRSLIARVATTADVLGIHSTAALLFTDRAVGDETLAALGAEPNVISACLFDAQGAPFAEYVREGLENGCGPLWSQQDRYAFEGGNLKLVHWIRADGERAGAIQFVWDSRELREKLESSVVIFLAVLGLTALGAILIASRLQRAVTVPLTGLVQGSEALAQGDLSVAVQARSRDEIGVLANAFNSMAGSLRGLIAQVRENILAVAAASDSLQKTGRAMSEESGRQESIVERTADSLMKVTGSIDDVNENVGRLDESARETAASMIEMDASVSGIADHMDQLASAIDVTSSSIAQLSASIREIAENMEGLDNATESTSKSLQDLHASVAQVEANAVKCHDLTQNAAEEAERGSRTVDQTVAAMHQIRASFSGLQEVIGELADTSESIGEIVQVIGGVAEETNLLSLNAAIIAAQAGEHGKAFSVVATSVKSLAERTARSTREIGSLVESVQDKTRKAVAAMTENAERVARGVELSNEAGTGLRQIMESAGMSANMVREIVENSEVQARDLEEVDRAMVQVKDTVSQIDRSIQEHKRASSEIATSIEQIRILGQDVKGSTEEQSRSGKLITQAMHQITSMIEHILEATRNQATQSEHIREALDTFRAVTVENAQRAEELGDTVSGLSERSSQLEREIGRFTL